MPLQQRHAAAHTPAPGRTPAQTYLHQRKPQRPSQRSWSMARPVGTARSGAGRSVWLQLPRPDYRAWSGGRPRWPRLDLSSRTRGCRSPTKVRPCATVVDSILLRAGAARPPSRGSFGQLVDGAGPPSTRSADPNRRVADALSAPGPAQQPSAAAAGPRCFRRAVRHRQALQRWRPFGAPAGTRPRRHHPRVVCGRGRDREVVARQVCRL